MPFKCSRREPENASKRQPSTVQALSKHPTFLSKHPRNHNQKPGFYCPSFATEWPFYNIKFRNSDLTHAWERATHPACDVKSRILPRERFDAFLWCPVTHRLTPSHFLQVSSLSSPYQRTPSPGIASMSPSPSPMPCHRFHVAVTLAQPMPGSTSHLPRTPLLAQAHRLDTRKGVHLLG